MAIAAVQQIIEKIQIYTQSNYKKNIYNINLWLQVICWTQYLQNFTISDNFNIL